MSSRERRRRVGAVIVIGLIVSGFVHFEPAFYDNVHKSEPAATQGATKSSPALSVLATLAVKGRAPKTGYNRDLFGGEWKDIAGTCDARNVILQRDLVNTQVNDKCQVLRGTLHDPYTGKTIGFVRGAKTSSAVQIDHVVAVSDAWQSGAQQLTKTKRVALYNDPLELLAVDGPANQQKSDGDAATWLPSNKAFRCQYVARQIAVKAKYNLWVKPAEKAAMKTILSKCPGQKVPTGALGKES